MTKGIETPALFATDSIEKNNGSEEKNKRPKRKLTEAEKYWNKCLAKIRKIVTPQVYKTWFKPIKGLTWSENTLTLKVPSQFFCEWISEHYYSLMQKTIENTLGSTANLQYEVVVDDKSDSLDKRAIKVPAFKYPPKPSQYSLNFEDRPVIREEFKTYLNPRYTFDNFIRGDSNQLAGSAAIAVGRDPGGTKFNPLTIYGSTGLGKTHLAQAIGNYIVSKKAGAKALYTTSEAFTMEFVNAIQTNKTNEFMNHYRSVDVLIVDDIQFFEGKEKTQDHFFHTFNALHQAGKQIVLTSDRPAKDLKDVDARLLSRFQWGLTADIQAPDLEMRMAILRKKSGDEGIDLPQDVVEFMARRVTKSVRELEGALISLIAKVTLDNREMSLDLAKEVVDGVAGSEPKPITIDDIKLAVSGHYSISVEKIESKSRKHEITLARQMAMYLAKKLTPLSLKSIGSNFGGRDHSTVLHSCQTIDNYLSTDDNIKKSFEILFGKFKNR